MEYYIGDEVSWGDQNVWRMVSKNPDKFDCIRGDRAGEKSVKPSTYYSSYLVKKSSKNNMNLSEKMALVFKGEPEKSFIKAGIIDISEELTEEGWEIFGTWLLKKNGDAFKKEVVDPILEDMKNDK